VVIEHLWYYALNHRKSIPQGVATKLLFQALFRTTAHGLLASILLKEMRYLVYTAISIKVVHEQSGKVEYERERLLGIAYELMNFQSDSQQPFALVFDFSAAFLVDNLN
jgi:hypothetical protein